jgi:transglutaminase-like putative cysteine protease
MLKGQTYWDTKHPWKPLIYRGRPLPGAVSMPGQGVALYELDVRRFIWPEDTVITKTILDNPILHNVRANSCDKIAKAALAFVRGKVSYVSDKTFGSPEYWMFPVETLRLGKGDCEDGAILLVTLIRNLGCPAWRIRVAAGDVQGGGHAWASYCREEDEQWVALDWCYWPTENPGPINQDNRYFRGEKVWFSFNDEFAWSELPDTQIEGRVK